MNSAPERKNIDGVLVQIFDALAQDEDECDNDNSCQNEDQGILNESPAINRRPGKL
jgi:hypothetical protein